ncbi:FAD-dependent oxidoreductase [Coraliomargarita sp. W4R72]
MKFIQLRCDILVAGGGVAGVCCALEAARNGCRVVLCQNRGVLGGNASSEVRMHVVGADAHGSRGIELETEARESGLIEEIRLRNSSINAQRSISMLDLTLYDMCRSEPNIELLLNSEVVSVTMVDDVIETAKAVRQSTEDTFLIAAKVFVDCTGDGGLGAEAGAHFRLGREGREEFNEPLAQPVPDEMKLGSSLLYQAREHDHPMPFIAPKWARKITEEDMKLRFGLKDPHCELGLEYGFWWLEWGGHLDTISDNEIIRDELMSILMGVWDYIKNSGLYPSSANWALEWCGFLPGKRESRRFIGQYILKMQDIMDAPAFDDAIAYGGWWIDTHPPMGVDSPEEPPCCQHHVPYLYEIPLRSCVSGNIKNLMFAGRNISATHLAFASTRVMGTCAAIGQGVGAAAVVAVREDLSPYELAMDAQAMKAIQQLLLKDDAFLIGVTNEDAEDLAQIASVSSLQGDAPEVLSGQTRSVHGDKGARTERANPGVHRWISKTLPADLTLEWESEQTFHEIRIVFDTGLNRELTLTLCNAVAQRLNWGVPQPECVKDYRLEVRSGEDWIPIVSETNNFLRHRIHRLEEPVTTNALRLVCESTNGAAGARVCEMRVYK